MFGKKETRLETIVGSESVVEGKIRGKGTLRVDGAVDGDVDADSVVIGETGTVKGTIRTKRLVVGGRVEGNMVAEDSVDLRERAVVRGEIRTARISIREGARFDGRAVMEETAEKKEGEIVPIRS
jgi:cytoskeletal protein CcmA (bactofilin family)